MIVDLETLVQGEHKKKLARERSLKILSQIKRINVKEREIKRLEELEHLMLERLDCSVKGDGAKNLKV